MTGHPAKPSEGVAANTDARSALAQDNRRQALIERIGTIADLAASKPLEGELGDVAYDLLREAAAQIASDHQRLAILSALPQVREIPTIVLSSAEPGEEGYQLHGLFYSFDDALAHVAKDENNPSAQWDWRQPDGRCYYRRADGVRWTASNEPIRTMPAAAPKPTTEDAVPEGCVGEMTPRRAIYFLDRFKRDEKMLGPHEQWALDYAMAALSSDPKAAVEAERERWQHVAYFDEGEFHWMSGITPRDCELYAPIRRTTDGARP